MRFGTTRSQFYDAQKTARAKWDATGDEWDDAVRREHGEKIVDELDKSVSDVLRRDRSARDRPRPDPPGMRVPRETDTDRQDAIACPRTFSTGSGPRSSD